MTDMVAAMKSLGVFLGTVIAVGVLVGCQGTSDAGVTPAVSNSASVAPTTPVLSPTPVKDTLNAEAEARYRAFLVEQFKLEEAGGVDTLGPIISGFLDEPYRTQFEKAFVAMKQVGVRVEGTSKTSPPQVTVIDEKTVPGAVVALRSCLDGRQTTVVSPDETSQPGAIVQNDYWFKRDAAGALRIFEGDGKLVESC